MYGGKAAFEVIPNAISTQRFCPDEVRRRAVREDLGIRGRFVVGTILPAEESKVFAPDF